MVLDYAAREPFWRRNLNYNHGTGHGVGYLLNVHEGPNSFRWKNLPGNPAPVLEEGMITLPLSASIGDADVSVNYQLEDSAPENAIAQVQYTYNDRVIGSAYLLNRIGEPEETISLPPETAAAGTEAAAGSAATSSPLGTKSNPVIGRPSTSQ